MEPSQLLNFSLCHLLLWNAAYGVDREVQVVEPVAAIRPRLALFEAVRTEVGDEGPVASVRRERNQWPHRVAVEGLQECDAAQKVAAQPRANQVFLVRHLIPSG